MENGPGLKMYFLLKMVVFQPAMLVYQRVYLVYGCFFRFFYIENIELLGSFIKQFFNSFKMQVCFPSLPLASKQDSLSHLIQVVWCEEDIRSKDL